MIRGRVWRYLTIFLAAYFVLLVYFVDPFGSGSSTEPTAAAVVAPLPDAKDPDPKPVEPAERKTDHRPPSDLEPVMTKGVLGNYEPKNVKKISGPGEDGAGVQLQGEEERKLGDQSVAEFGFNEVASDKISLDRHARDTR